MTLVYLDEAPTTFNKFQIPGAISNASWMGKLLYCWKIVLLSDHMEKLVNIFSKRSSNKNKRLFVILCVLLCSVVDHGFTHTASAPHNDVQMINEASHPELANAAKKAMTLHMWYLT